MPRLGLPRDGYRPRTRPRYWQFGLYILEEDEFGYVFILGRDTLTAGLDRRPVVIPSGTEGYDRTVAAIEKSIELIRWLAP